jgi:hypothetical protein
MEYFTRVPLFPLLPGNKEKGMAKEKRDEEY